MTDFTRRIVEVEGGSLAYAEGGAGDAVVCIDGQSGERPSRAHVLLAERYRVVVFRLPDTNSARLIGKALEKLGIARFNLMGHDRGADVALQLGIESPEKIEAAILLAPPAPDRDIEKRLGEFKSPVLALFGTNDRSAPPESADRYRALLPDCNLMFVYDASHAIDIDRPEAAAYIAREFFERRDQFLVSRESGLILP